MKLKTTSLLAFAVLAGTALLLATSCKKDSGTPSTAINGMFATVGDTAFASTMTEFSFDTTLNLYNLVGVAYKSYDSSVLELTVGGPLRLNVPVSSDTAVALTSYFSSSNHITYAAGNPRGKTVYEITSWDSVNHKIGGTFSGTLFNAGGGASPTDSLAITNGKFNFAY